MTEVISKQQQDDIAATWRDRAKAHELKPGSKKYDAALFHFLAGVITALQYTDPDARNDPSQLTKCVPPYWVLAGLSGRDPFEAIAEIPRSRPDGQS